MGDYFTKPEDNLNISISNTISNKYLLNKIYKEIPYNSIREFSDFLLFIGVNKNYLICYNISDLWEDSKSINILKYFILNNFTLYSLKSNSQIKKLYTN